ncbi:hypothetical protein CK203_047413 [Vitis vinifera]|uniref:Uncharacterized protein n=1 Tax=Vitis vinifera TaxID=29760 RepID=A0A438G1X8_VITVI|nr:hypothetical protein CK203_047413 [Vitis vinifera]
MEKVQEVAESQQKKEENKDASAAAGLLEKLSVEEKETEDKAEEEKPVAAKEEKETENGWNSTACALWAYISLGLAFLRLGVLSTFGQSLGPVCMSKGTQLGFLVRRMQISLLGCGERGTCHHNHHQILDLEFKTLHVLRLNDPTPVALSRSTVPSSPFCWVANFQSRHEPEPQYPASLLLSPVLSQVSSHGQIFVISPCPHS